MNEGNEAPLPTGGLVPTAYVPDYGHWNSETLPNPNTDWLQDHLSQQADVDKSSQLDPNPDCANVNCVWYGPLSAPGSESGCPGTVIERWRSQQGEAKRISNAVWWKGSYCAVLSQSRALSQAQYQRELDRIKQFGCQMDQPTRLIYLHFEMKK